MGADFDWYGIGAGLGRVGEELQAARQRRQLEQERQEERTWRREERERQIRRQETEDRREQARLRVHAALDRLNAALAHATSEDDPEVQAAAREYEAAMTEYTGGPFQLPRRGDVILPPQRVQRPPLTVADYARSQGIQLDEQSTATYGNMPLQDFLRLNEQAIQSTGRPLIPGFGQQRAQDQEREEEHQALDIVNRYFQAIVNARDPAARRVILNAGQRVRAALVARNPRLDAILPDLQQAAAQIESEERAQAAAQLASQRQEDWKRQLEAARDRLRQALKGADAFMVRFAIDEYNALINAGRQAGWTTARPLDPRAVLSEWLSARSTELEKSRLDLQIKRAQLARLRREATEAGTATAGGGPQDVAQVGPYRITNYRDRRGNLTRQVIVDTRTGVVVPPDVLARRAEGGDQHAQRLVHGQEERLSPEDARREIQWIRDRLAADDIAMPRERLKPQERRQLERRLRDLERQFPDPAPSREAQDALRIAQGRRGRLPKDIWNRLTEQERQWLQRQGVRSE